MNPEFIEFKKQRELGEILSVTFKFLRENYKKAGKIFLKLVGPAFILLIAAVTYYTWSTVGVSFISDGGIFQTSNIIISAGLMLLAYLLYVTSMTGTVYHIILSYIKNKGEIISSEVAAGMKSDFGKILLITLISWILIFAGTILFIIPGIYVAIPVSLATAILVFRGNSVMDSISDCFQLIKDNWWTTFGTLFCIGLIVYLISLVFQLPAIFYFLIKAFVSASEGSAATNVKDMFGIGYIIINIFTSIVQYLVYSITPIGIAFIYFNLNEKQNYTGTYETIQNLGNNK
ncbi:hypothetical protein [Christiangramia forsetii]|uniref:Membrane protein containing DUF975 n=2 Tax=Christiangramia forsetii TaxID=411153 RepID=A0M032_CHRFK|nr:hypothetical protein [Christiangramia forsetii]GGG46018.1 hypothetical protein GCM10011532_32420 [Christiangramia forsetii]CAL65977.1 conserved hypothetical protein, membrane [Christiangramia forsetii KT0803]